MTKSELMVRLVERYTELGGRTISAKDINKSVKIISDTMVRALSKGDRIEIRGFGSFDLKKRDARVGRNPKTGASVKVPAKYVPHFKAGKELRDRVDASAK